MTERAAATACCCSEGQQLEDTASEPCGETAAIDTAAMLAWRAQAEAELRSLPPTRASMADQVATLGVVRALGVWPVHRGTRRGDRRRRDPWRFNRAGARRVLNIAERLARRPVPLREVTVTDRLTGQVRTLMRPTQYGGLLSAHVIRVLRALMRFINREGKAWPSYETLAKAAGLGLNTVKRAVRYLQALNIIDWTQRCRPKEQDGVYWLVQDTNEYVLVPPEEWLGYSPDLEPAPAPTPDTWGAAEKIDVPPPETLAEARARTDLEAALARLRAARDRGGG